MATPEETIDPNDLDSIDALLDEAELEVPKASKETSNSEQDAIDTLLDEAELAEKPIQKDQSNDANVKSDDAMEVMPDLEGSDLESKQSTMKKMVAEEANSQPVTTQPTLKTEMTAKDMDAIKKLIIIFGSTLIVLILIGIGIGIWSALASQTSTLDEENQTLIESVQVNTERVATNMMDSYEMIQTIEKKLDALNFQLEQLTADLLDSQASGTTPDKVAPILDPLGLNTHQNVSVKEGGGAIQAMPNPVINPVIVPDSESHKLTLSMNKKMISTQRRIDEINRRVKDIQAKHKALLLSIKSLEKQVILQQKRMASKEKEVSKKQESSPYQYSAPDGSYYDQSVGDTYP